MIVNEDQLAVCTDVFDDGATLREFFEKAADCAFKRRFAVLEIWAVLFVSATHVAIDYRCVVLVKDAVPEIFDQNFILLAHALRSTRRTKRQRCRR